MRDDRERPEPEYVPLGDEFESRAWQYPDTDLQERILQICGRKYFHKESEKKSIEGIESRPDFYRPDYVEGKLEWAEGKNKTRTVIVLPVLLKTIRNRDNIAKWLNKLAEDAKDTSTLTDEDYEDGASPIPKEFT